jgi:hypothetical protein
MKNILNDILEDAKIAYKESIIISNETLEERLLSIIGNTKLLLNELQNSNKKVNPQIKDETKIKLNAIEKVKKRVPLWLRRPHQRNYKILVTYMALSENNRHSILLSLLEKNSGLDSKEFTSHYNQMKSFAEKAHGKVFEEENGQVKLWKPIADFVVEQFKTTIQKAIKKSLNDISYPMSANDILDHINKHSYYPFGAKDPSKAVSSELSKLIKKEEIIRETNENNEYIYKLKV